MPGKRGGGAYVPMKRVNDHRKAYISPYSIKAMVK